MAKKFVCLAAVVVLGISFIATNIFAEESTEGLKARLDELRQKKAQGKYDYDEELVKINKEADEKISKLKAEFHKTRDEYLRDKKDKTDKLRAGYDDRIKPILDEEKKIVEVIGASLGMNFAKPKKRE